MPWFFVFFVGSGFAGLVYEVVWLRLAMATFGVTTPLVSIVLSVFMAGLGLGSLVVGRLARHLDTTPRRALVWYAVAEAAIGAFALLVPALLDAGRAVLTGAGTTVAWNSASYYAASGGWIALTMLPACIAMGATFPLAMAAIRGGLLADGTRSFSFLYLANVLGAMAGTVVAAFVLIELLGFRTSLLVAVAVNFAIAAAALARARHLAPAAAGAGGQARRPALRPHPFILPGLFLTGLVSMAMELVWIRQFTPYLGNLVYAFALILSTYLAATFLGSRLYRTWLGPDASAQGAALLWLAAAAAALLPLAAADPRLALPPVLRLALGVAPVCAAIGVITPMLVDRWSGGDPDRAGAAYATNVLGAIGGPLVAAFWLLPWVGEHRAIILLAVPLFAVGALAAWQPALFGSRMSRRSWASVPVLAGLALILLLATRSYESLYPIREVRRDHTATLIATSTGMDRDLQVNGIRTTRLTPITKWMAHLPLAFLERPAADALVICFGMGTTFRSLLSWGIEATAVELIPSVPGLFAFYHADAPELVRSPKARIVIDDGRRFLERSPQRYDVITIDPPNPPEAAGSSLLYSREFYAIARARLRPGGLVHQWIPATDVGTVASVTRALRESFPHVRAFPVANPTADLDVLGVHYLASERPIPRRSPAALAGRLPARATADLMEWPYAPTPEAVFAALLHREIPLDALISLAPGAPALVDDRPYNEYFLLRRWVF